MKRGIYETAKEHLFNVTFWEVLRGDKPSPISFSYKDAQVEIYLKVNNTDRHPTVEVKELFVANPVDYLSSTASYLEYKLNDEALEVFNRAIASRIEEARYEANYERIGGCYAYK